MTLASDLRYEGLKAEISSLEAKIEQQKQDIEAQDHMHSILTDQIQQSVDRNDAMLYETEKIKALFESVQRRVLVLSSENDELEANIQMIRSKVSFPIQYQP